MMFETATLVRLAPWLTSVIFLWSLLSGLLGGQWIHHDRCTVYSVSVVPTLRRARVWLNGSLIMPGCRRVFAARRSNLAVASRPLPSPLLSLAKLANLATRSPSDCCTIPLHLPHGPESPSASPLTLPLAPWPP